MTFVAPVNGESQEQTMDGITLADLRRRLQKVEAEKEALAAALAVQQQLAEWRARKLQIAEESLRSAQRTISWYKHSLQFRFGEAVWAALQPSRQTLRSPLAFYRILKDSVVLLRTRRRHKGLSKGAAPHAQARSVPTVNLLPELQTYLQQVAETDAPHFVLMFSGTTFIQEQRGNRPIRLTLALQEANVPVLFSYWRANRADPIPANPHPLIFQSPIDLTLQHLRWLLENVPPTKRRLFVVSFPYPAVVGFINLANALGWATLYDARDDWEEFQKVGQAHWYIPAVEKYVIANCDLTTAVSRPLAEKLQRLAPGRQIDVNPNALDPKFLQLRQTFPRSKQRSQPIIGYVGHLTPSWFDWEGLKALAVSAPEWRFELIGHHTPQDLHLPANVEYLGPKSHAEIAQITASWHAAIIPFRLGSLADAVDPIKVYEYLALGLPVVSCRMPQIRDYPYVWTAETPSQFLQCLKEALAVNFDQDAVDRWLSQNLWSTRANDFLHWTDTILSTPDPLKSLHL